MDNITRKIYLANLDIMKKVLDLGAFKLESKNEFTFYKAQVMDYFYNDMIKLFQALGYRKCECNSNIRNGYNDCSYCGGSGYKFKITEN